MDINVNQLELPKASVHAQEALAIIASDEPDLLRLETAIMQDPLLASMLIRYANSPLNRRSADISNVPTALRLLGLKSVRSAIVTATIQSLVIDDTEISKQILEHMLGISALCKLITRCCCREAAEDLEFLGLIHDLGMLTLAANLKQTYADVATQAQQSGEALDVAERAAFGISHNVVSARVAVDFRLPKPHIELLQRFHQHPATQDRPTNKQQRDTHVLCLAHHLLEQLVPQENCIHETVVESADDARQALGLSEEQISSLCDEFSMLATVSD